MRRLIAVSAIVALAAAALAAWGGATPAREAGPAKAEAKLPPLPANIKSRGFFNIAVKCDSPPFGYIDVRGRNAGFDVEIARRFAAFAFGRSARVKFTCVTTPAREPALTSDRVDMVIATFTYTADRDTRIDFSRAYWKGTGRLLVKNDSAVQKLSDLAGKRVATTSGSVYDRWMKNCFKSTQVIVADTFTNAMLAFNQGRADAVMYDDAVLIPVAAADRNSKITDDVFLQAPFGIGMKQGNTQMKAWVDSRLALMKKKDQFLPILKANVPTRFVPAFSKTILRPNNNFTYAAPGSPSVDTVCP